MYLPGDCRWLSRAFGIWQSHFRKRVWLREDRNSRTTIQHGRAHGSAVATNVGAPRSVVASSTKAPQVHFSLKPADGA